ncbi:MAG TPA: ATP-binding protein [Anaeromyxobacteraceae bacterium]|nr:ATP-binding protein [Anaeromyxobacteraceae bacterium]
MTTNDLAGRPIYLMLRMKPPWVFVDEIRRFVESFCACACPGQTREAQVALAVHELMQNAIPHAGGEDVDLTLQVDPAADRIEIAVSNPCTDAELAELQARVERINAEPDALRSYLRAMAEAPVTSRGGLGLARVRFEAQLELAVIREGQRVTVLARGPLNAPQLASTGGHHV